MSAPLSVVFCLAFLLLPFNLLNSIHVRTKFFGNYHCPVALLIVLKKRKPQSTDCHSRPVQGVNKLRLRFLFTSKPDACAASLKRLAVRTRRDLAISVLARQPDFDVIGLRRRKSKISGRKRNSAISKPELFKHGFRVARQ